MLRVAVDAMGGDHSPRVVVDAVRLLSPEERETVILVGDPERIGACGVDDLSLEIVPSEQVVEMDESPSAALKKKKHSSIAVCMNLVKKGRAEAMVSMGNTGAVMAFALFQLERIPGIARPAIATLIPTAKEPAILLDVGANVDCKPKHLLQFGVMGSVYVQEVLGRPSPRVGLLSIGSEASKGNELTAATRALMETAPIHFVGHVEGNDLCTGDVDVVVCDGFVGNVMLKFGEGLAEHILGAFRHQVEVAGESSSKNSLAHALKKVMASMDYSEYGGAPLLGLQGTCLVGHGRSSAKAISNAIRAALEAAAHHLNEKILEAVSHLKA